MKIKSLLGLSLILLFSGILTCSKATVIFEQGFEEGVFPPSGWLEKGSETLAGEQFDIPEDEDFWNSWFDAALWEFPTYIHSGESAAGIGYYPIFKFLWLISPEYQLNSGASELKYWMWYQSSLPGYFTKFHIMVKEDGSDVWTLVETVLYEETVALYYVEEQVTDLTEFSDKKIKIAFVYERTGAYQLALDDISLESEGGVGISESNEINNFSLFQNYPNPFNPTTTINYSLNSTSQVSLAVFNARGEKVSDLVNGRESKGNHSVFFDGSNLNSGIYFYKLTVNGVSVTKKMVLTK
ncbi:MAG: hypothetical protein CR982_06735 [Candidatus Cloacimonadota bacterium]|nr:MAG: hypothetical protein CR982_06735 [Candidatus Cloacimonadota bacterium]PIE77821.1 MAG: hypothetical protein CSA15_11030 [Candidatus Delongbacteria bacterium]